MKANNYCYIVKFDDKTHVVFNGITKAFMLISSDNVASYSAIIDDSDKYIESHPAIIEQLLELGAILEDNADPKAILAAERKDYINLLEYKTTILPTYECNYSCWYCLQKHTPVKIDYDKINLIIKHIQKYIISNHIKSYVLSWFGGEPLTQPGIIDYLSSRMLEFCREHDVEFSSGITTNGALLSEENIRMLMAYEINYYQITLDGEETAHNKVKHDSLAESSFTLILTNIANLLTTNPRACVTLRLNYTLSMLKSKNLVSDISKYIPWRLRDRINVDLQKVWQIKEEIIPIEDLCNLQRQLVENGFILNINHVFSICYVDKIHYNMFYYNGAVEKCDKRPMDSARGYIDENGDLVWKEAPVFQNYDLLDENCVCGSCDYYPLCYNGCPIAREERILKYGKVICGYKGNPELLEGRIRDRKSVV